MMVDIDPPVQKTPLRCFLNRGVNIYHHSSGRFETGLAEKG